MKRSALIVGVNRYEDPEINRLEYAENDAIELYSYFSNRPEYYEVSQLMSPDSEELLDTAHAMAWRLSEGDLFVIYFAGHGIEHEGQHLLLFPRVKHSRIDFLQQALPLRLLERETEKGGLNRVMILDTCRSPLLHGARGEGTAAMRDVQCIRDMVAGHGSKGGAMGILCSCDEGQQSMEIRDCRHGIFSLSLLQTMKELDAESRGVKFSDELENAISDRMKKIGDNYGLTIRQRPWVRRSGEIPPIIEPFAVGSRLQSRPVGSAETRVTSEALLYNTAEVHKGEAKASKPESTPEEDITLTIPGPGKVQLRMKLIPPGNFMMGSPKNEKDRFDNEGPQHKVTITKPFHMGIYTVTQRQWKEVVGRNPSLFKGQENPVESISWVYCQKFISNLNAMGLGYFRLPTEAEWEYACRAGSAARFPWGDDKGNIMLGQYAWYDGNSSKTTHPVGKKLPNAWGLYDMHGNVYEWCSDWYGPYSNAEQADPGGPDCGSGRVVRGGSWSSHVELCRSALRLSISPSDAYRGIGFRLVRTSI